MIEAEGESEQPRAVPAAPFRWPRGEEPLIFISYRVGLRAYPAQNLWRALSGEFGVRRVFRDKDSLGHGVKWADVLEQALNEEKLRLVICIVAEDFWTYSNRSNIEGADEASSRPRLWDEDDWVYRELRTAIDRQRREGGSFQLDARPPGRRGPTAESEGPSRGNA